MDKLLETLAASGIDGTSMDQDQLLKVARAVGINPDDFLPRQVEVVDYTNKRDETNKFVKTPSFVVGTKKDGTPQTVRGLFLRLEAVPQALADLTSIASGLDTDEG